MQRNEIIQKRLRHANQMLTELLMRNDDNFFNDLELFFIGLDDILADLEHNELTISTIKPEGSILSDLMQQTFAVINEREDNAKRIIGNIDSHLSAIQRYHQSSLYN